MLAILAQRGIELNLDSLIAHLHSVKRTSLDLAGRVERAVDSDRPPRGVEPPIGTSLV